MTSRDRDLRALDAAISVDMTAQPDDETCGPTCLHAVYRYFGQEVSLAEVIDGIDRLWHGGTVGVHLARHALARGMDVTLHTYNLRVFDPTWFQPGSPDLAGRLAARAEARPEFAELCEAYRDFLAEGGKLRHQPLDAALLRRYLRRDVPLITGLSATYLYGACREDPATCRDDDVAGDPAGHFVVLCGYEADGQRIRVADPYHENPVSGDHFYMVTMSRLVGAIFLGVLTHDANFLAIEPRRGRPR